MTTKKQIKVNKNNALKSTNKAIKQKATVSPDNKAGELVKIFNNNLDLMLFFITWLKNGLNASKAYKKLHPEVTDHSARTLGSRELAKVDKTAIMQSYGLDVETYFRQLKEGLKAIRLDAAGQVFPDHKTRRAYHEVLGKLLNIEEEKVTTGVGIRADYKNIEVVIKDY
jgi:hypothetical protein